MPARAQHSDSSRAITARQLQALVRQPLQGICLTIMVSTDTWTSNRFWILRIEGSDLNTHEGQLVTVSRSLPKSMSFVLRGSHSMWVIWPSHPRLKAPESPSRLGATPSR